jgi:phosphotransferase system enzyme I (PtsP)
LATIHEGDEIALDGDVGLVVVHPSDEVVGEFSRRLEQERLYRKHLEGYRELPCQTQDGERIGIFANVAMEGDILQLEHYGAEGVGLYRTEIYFLSLDRYPQMGEQEKTYSRILSHVPKEQRMIFRTLDIGADKAAPYMGFQQEENPFLGLRALRRQLRQPEVLKKQIKALFLAARTHDNVQLLFPMVMELDEFRKAKKLVEKCRNELELQGLDVPKLPVGAMFEVPAAVMLCDHFMPELDFCSIGSNDLTQYVLAVDRNNPQTSNLYDPLHPSVLQLIQRLADSAKRHGKPLELCGEMASDPDGCVVLVGLGIRLLSMNPPLIPVVKERLSQVTLEQAQKIAKRALEMHSAGEVRRHIRRTIGTARKLPA